MLVGEAVFWTMDVVFCCAYAVFLSSKIVNVQSHEVHPSSTKHAFPHVSIHAQLPSMVFSFPTNHVIPWLFRSFLRQSQKPKQSQDVEKPHRKWSLRDYMYHVWPPIGARQLFQVLLSTHDKPIPLTLLPTGNTLRETKQICYSHSDCWSLLSGLRTCIHKSYVPYEEVSAEMFQHKSLILSLIVSRIHDER